MMVSLACHATASVLLIAGCALLALSQTRQWRTVTERADSPPVAARLAGWMLVLASAVPCVVSEGTSFAILVWPLLLPLAAMMVALTLAYSPKKLRPLANLLRNR